MNTEDKIKYFRDLMDFSNPDNVYVAMLLPRKKDGFELNIGDSDKNIDLDSEMKVRKVISSKEEYDIAMDVLLKRAGNMQTARVYVMFNPRSSLKAYGLLQSEIANNLHNIKSVIPRINRLDREFKSYLMKPQSKAKTGYFLLDIDDKNADLEAIANRVHEVGSEIMLMVPTKNGYHMLILPCNPNLLKFDKVEIKNDAMICLYFK